MLPMGSGTAISRSSITMPPPALPAGAYVPSAPVAVSSGVAPSSSVRAPYTPPDGSSILSGIGSPAATTEAPTGPGVSATTGTGTSAAGGTNAPAPASYPNGDPSSRSSFFQGSGFGNNDGKATQSAPAKNSIGTSPAAGAASMGASGNLSPNALSGQKSAATNDTSPALSRPGNTTQRPAAIAPALPLGTPTSPGNAVPQPIPAASPAKPIPLPTPTGNERTAMNSVRHAAYYPSTAAQSDVLAERKPDARTLGWQASH
jgi:hypothetical protein